jgi:hypothetical protein
MAAADPDTVRAALRARSGTAGAFQANGGLLALEDRSRLLEAVEWDDGGGGNGSDGG